MVKIKGWSKTLQLPYRIDYDNTTKNYNKKLFMGDTALIIIREKKYPDANFEPNRSEWSNTWKVVHRKYMNKIGQRYKVLKKGVKKQTALNFAYNYMKKNPKG